MKIGLVLPISESDDGQLARYAEIRDLARGAEATGLDSVWVYDHLLFRFRENPTRGIWEAWTLLAGVAEATARVELGTLVVCTAFRNPAVLAKMAATLDEVSGGRLILGLGAGWHQPEFDAFGLLFDHKVGRFAEALDIIVPLLREGRVDFTGEYYAAPNCELTPRGPRPGGPPIMIGAFGPRMLRLTAEHADAWNTCWLGQPTKLAERRAELEAACATVGRDPATLEVTVGINVAVPELGEPAAPDHDPDTVLTGSADEIAAGLRVYADLGVGHAICALTPNNAAGLDRFAAAVRAYRG